MNPNDLEAMPSDLHRDGITPKQTDLQPGDPGTAPAPLPITEDPDRDGRPGVQSWPFVALALGLVILALAALLALLLTGTVTWAEVKDAVIMLGSLATGAGLTHGAHKAGGH